MAKAGERRRLGALGALFFFVAQQLAHEDDHQHQAEYRSPVNWHDRRPAGGRCQQIPRGQHAPGEQQAQTDHNGNGAAAHQQDSQHVSIIFSLVFSSKPARQAFSVAILPAQIFSEVCSASV